VLHKITTCKYGASFKNIVITFKVKRVIIIHVSILVNEIFDHKCHVTEAKVDPVSKDDKVVRSGVNSVSILQFKGTIFHMKIFNSKVVGFSNAALVAVNNIIILCHIWPSILILEEESMLIGVKRLDFFIGLQVPNNHAVFCL
jgi:hypothetical protein